MKIKSITPIAPEPSRCIEVSSDDRLFAAGGIDGSSIVSHNSVAQRNIIFSCIMRPDNWYFLGIDLKKVELSGFRAYSNVVMGIATTLQDALTILRFGQQTMMSRYAEMEEMQKNSFMDLPGNNRALMIMVDEAGELLSPSGVKALVGSTVLPTPAGRKSLESLAIGDTVYDNFGHETKITRKYTPERQDRYDMKITSNKTGATETFTAGSEHNWVAYFTYPDGEVEGPEIVDTAYLAEFKKYQDTLPIENRTTVKFKRG